MPRVPPTIRKGRPATPCEHRIRVLVRCRCEHDCGSTKPLGRPAVLVLGDLHRVLEGRMGSEEVVAVLGHLVRILWQGDQFAQDRAALGAGQVVEQLGV